MRKEKPSPLSRLDLEALISDAFDAVTVADLVLDSVAGCRIKEESFPRRHVEGYVTYLLTEDQDRALHAAMKAAFFAARELETRFLAGE